MGELPIGVMYRRENPPENLTAYARLAERLGYDELWLVEDCFFASGIASAAAAAAATERLTIGLGILPAAFRNPAVTAMELATLGRMFPGRIRAGLGHGVTDWVRQVGAAHPSPLAVLGETVEAVRALLAGGTVSVSGRHANLAGVALEYPPEPAPPVAMGVRNVRSLRLSGRSADGTVLAEGASSRYVSWARERIDEGRRDAGRTDPHRLTVYAQFDLDESATDARRELAGWVLRSLPAADDDVASTVADLLRAHPDPADLAEALPEELVDRFAVAGTGDRCAAAVRRLAAAGADAVVLAPPKDPQLAVAQITMAADELLPLLR
ncbi:LLM class flavin-dependent oxidoreductase [Plantactinospora sp. GCM10030261]|uniref:LLM class flavin-dependent oxidoreductase n=1 Tax=Plantactinospora sp. GCM10030261 TaxID=3273420 RepID=UPI00360E4D0C